MPQNFLEFFNPSALPMAIGVIVGTVLLVRFTDRLVQRLSDRRVTRRLLIKQANTLFAFTAFVLATAWAISTLFRLSSEAILALSGTLAVAGGFALKDVASSFLAGITILVNRPFQVGDRIHFDGFYGEVKEIGLRSVRLVTLDDNVVTIPSNRFMEQSVACANAGALDCMVVIDFLISPAADHVRARELVQDAVLASQYLFLGKPWVVRTSTEATADGRVLVKLRAKAYVYDARQETAFSSDVCDRVLRAFRASGIVMPAG